MQPYLFKTAVVCAAAIILLLLIRFRGRLRFLGVFLINAAAGFGGLWAMNAVGGIAGVSMGLNLFNTTVIGILGLPGFALLLFLKRLYGI